MCCVCFYLVYLVCRSLFQLPLLALLTIFWNPAIGSDCARYDLLHYFFMLIVTFLASLFLWKLHVAQFKLAPVARLSLNK